MSKKTTLKVEMALRAEGFLPLILQGSPKLQNVQHYGDDFNLPERCYLYRWLLDILLGTFQRCCFLCHHLLQISIILTMKILNTIGIQTSPSPICPFPGRFCGFNNFSRILCLITHEQSSQQIHNQKFHSKLNVRLKCINLNLVACTFY